MCDNATFFEKLRDRTLSNIDVVKSGWSYCGDNSQKGQQTFESIFPRQKPPAATDSCFCGQEIKRNFYITNNTKNQFIVLGSTCIKIFQKRLCTECGQQHRNVKDKLCNECRVKRFLESINHNETVWRVSRWTIGQHVSKKCMTEAMGECWWNTALKKRQFQHVNVDILQKALNAGWWDSQSYSGDRWKNNHQIKLYIDFRLNHGGPPPAEWRPADF